MKGKFRHKDKDVETVPSVACKSSIDYANFTSELCFIIFDKVGISFITDFIVDMKSLLSFAFYRQNVEFGVIKISISQDNKIFTEIGSFFVLGLFDKEMEKPEITNFSDFGFIPWEIFYTKIDKIIEAITSNQLYLYHLQENKRLKEYVSIVSILKDASAF